MKKRLRQSIGILSAIVAYYIVHEGAHLIYAIVAGVFKGVEFSWFGVEILVDAERMGEFSIAAFCIAGSIATLIVAYVLIFLTDKVVKVSSKLFRCCMYYITLALLVIDPLYLSVLFALFGGGDMNGISLIIPEVSARVIYGSLLLLNVLVFKKIVVPEYRASFDE